MTFDWTEYLSVAEGLCGVAVLGPIAGIEAQQRVAVSRAYYAAFVIARNRLRDVDSTRVPAGSNVHQFVASEYQRHSDPRRARIGSNLHRLRRSRNMCDYEDIVAGLPRLTRQSLTRAARLLADLRRL